MHGRGARARDRQARLQRPPLRDRPARPQAHLAGSPARLRPPRAATGPYPGTPSSCSTRSTGSAPRPPRSCSRSSTPPRKTASAPTRRSPVRSSRHPRSSARRTTRAPARPRWATGSRSSSCPATARRRNSPSPGRTSSRPRSRPPGDGGPVRVTRGACRRSIRDYTSERGIRKFALWLQRNLREHGAQARDRRRLARPHGHHAATGARFLGEAGAGHADGLDGLRAQLEASALPDAVRTRKREVPARLESLLDHMAVRLAKPATS